MGLRHPVPSKSAGLHIQIHTNICRFEFNYRHRYRYRYSYTNTYAYSCTYTHMHTYTYSYMHTHMHVSYMRVVHSWGMYRPGRYICGQHLPKTNTVYCPRGTRTHIPTMYGGLLYAYMPETRTTAHTRTNTHTPTLYHDKTNQSSSLSHPPPSLCHWIKSDIRVVWFRNQKTSFGFDSEIKNTLKLLVRYHLSF